MGAVAINVSAIIDRGRHRDDSDNGNSGHTRTRMASSSKGSHSKADTENKRWSSSATIPAGVCIVCVIRVFWRQSGGTALRWPVTDFTLDGALYPEMS